MKRIVLIISFILIAIVLQACVATSAWTEVLKEIEIGYQEGNNKDYVTMDLILPTKSIAEPKAAIFWRSSDEDVIKEDGTVKRTSRDTSVVLTARIVINAEEKFKEFEVMVIGREDLKAVVWLLDGSTVDVLTNRQGLVELPEGLGKREGFTILHFVIKGTDQVFDFNQPIIETVSIVPVYETAFYEVRFDTNGGNEIVDVLIVEHSTTIDTLPTPVRDGFEFIGWIFKNKYGHDQLLLVNETIINSDIIAVAVWQKK